MSSCLPSMRRRVVASCITKQGYGISYTHTLYIQHTIYFTVWIHSTLASMQQNTLIHSIEVLVYTIIVLLDVTMHIIVLLVYTLYVYVTICLKFKYNDLDIVPVQSNTTMLSMSLNTHDI